MRLLPVEVCCFDLPESGQDKRHARFREFGFLPQQILAAAPLRLHLSTSRSGTLCPDDIEVEFFTPNFEVFVPRHS